MKKTTYCPECNWRWNEDEEKVFCCPKCGSKIVYPMDTITMEL